MEHVVLEFSRYEKERTYLRESITSRAGVRVEELNREDQMFLILGSRKESRR